MSKKEELPIVRAGVTDVFLRDQQPGLTHTSPIEHSQFIAWQVSQLYKFVQSLDKKIDNISSKSGGGCSCKEIENIIKNEIRKIPSGSGDKSKPFEAPHGNYDWVPKYYPPKK